MSLSRSCCKLAATARCAAVFVLLAISATTVAGETINDDTSPGSAETRFRDAQAAARAGDYARAGQAYAELMLEEADNVDHMFGYAQVLFWSGNYECAIRFLEQARTLAPDYEDVWELEFQARLQLRGHVAHRATRDFQRQAELRFPNAEWLRRTDIIAPKPVSWGVGATRDYLDNGTPSWRRFDLFFSYRTATNTQLSVLFDRMTRYGLTDDRIGGEVGVDIGTQWSGNVAVGASSAPNFLPARSARVGLVRRFDHGWLLGARLQHREYADDSVDTVGLLAERYVRNYRFAYALDRAQLASEQALVHSLAANVYTDAGAQYGIVLAAGEEIETVAPGQLLRTDIRSIAVTGRHPVGTDLGIGWSVGTQQQGALYRRSSVGVRIYGDF